MVKYYYSRSGTERGYKKPEVLSRGT